MNRVNRSLKDLTILYAEDDPDTLNLTAMVLEDYVGRLILAKNGQEAWNLFNQHKIDALLQDILMPKLGGLDLVVLNRQSTQPNVPIIITSAHTEVKYLLEAINLKVDNYILKPIEIDSLLKDLQRAILPDVQAKEIEAQNLLIKAISTFVGGKKIEIVKYLIEQCDEDKVLHGSYEDILMHLNVTKPTIVKTFKQLMNARILIKVRNKVYRFLQDFLIENMRF